MSNKTDRPALNKYRAAIIGCGGIGFRYDQGRQVAGALTHFTAFEQSDDFELVAICDTDAGTREQIADQHGKRVYGDYREMLAQEKSLDVVVVATPDETHEPILQVLAQYRPRLVFAEKPLALSPEAVTRLVEQYRQQGIGLVVNFYRRYTKELQELKILLDSGELGEVQAITVYYSRGFFHNCCHFIDLLCWYFGRPVEVFGLGMKPGLTDNDPTRNLLFCYPGGLEMRLVGLPTSQLLTYEVDILASQGRARILHQGKIEIYKVAPNRTWPEFLQYELIQEKPIDFSGALPAAVKNIKAWLDSQQALLSPGENSSLVFEIAGMIKEIH